MANNQAIINYLKVILGNDVESNIDFFKQFGRGRQTPKKSWKMITRPKEHLKTIYITSMHHEEDFEEFMENILDKNNSLHVRSYVAIRDIIFGRKDKGSNSHSSKSNKQQSAEQSNASRKKDKKKFKDINLHQEKTKEKQGRRPCDCMGQEHEFMNNCLDCGRIHCMDEGPGPCLFCGNFITVRGAEMYDLEGRKAKAMKPKENKVFDDDNDYFKVNAKKNTGKENKQKMVVALDFATRRVIESTQEDAKIKAQLLEKSIQHLKKVEEIYKNIQQHSEHHSRHLTSKHNKENNDLIDLLIQMRHKKPLEKEDLGVEDNIMPIIDYGTRVLDEDLISNTDHGLCLSLHQPLASLLVAGVKRHEGRVWPTSHRGRLWIAAAAKPPEEEDIEAAENAYREYYQDTTLKFPKEYPTGCLLGCVNIDDCLDQQTYRKMYPKGEENGSPYVFICSNPVILPMFYPIAGKHKIYPLEKELHKCAKMALQHATYVL